MRLTRTLKGAKMKKIILKGAWLRMSSLISELWNGSLDPSCYFGRNNNEIKQIEDLMEKTIIHYSKISIQKSRKF